MALAALLVGFAGAPAFAQTAQINASNPATLNQGNLRGATLSVTLTAAATYAAEADASQFTLTTAVPGLTVYSVAFNSARTVATLRLHYDGSDFDAAVAIAVTVAAAATSHNAALTTTNTRAVTPARWVNVSAKTLALTEGGSAGSYTVVLESPPTASVTVAITSDNAAVTVDTDATPLTRSLTFTTTTWNTAQTVTVTPVADNTDTVDELALVSNVATGGGYASSTVANRTVRVTVADDDTRTGTDYDVDDDQLIEIDSLAKLNAVRWDLDGNGAVAAGNATAYATAFPSAVTGMGCPDGGDSNQTPDGCRGYELTANLDFDTDGDGATHVNGRGDSEDDYYNGGSGWDPIGGLSASTRYRAIFRGNGHVIKNLFVRQTLNTVNYVGLFSLLGPTRIESLGLVDAYVWTNWGQAGAIAGFSLADIVGCYTAGAVVVQGYNVRRAGGFVGTAASQSGVAGSAAASYSIASVTTSPASQVGSSGGLFGRAHQIIGPVVTVTIDNSWAAGPVVAQSDTERGGLIGGIINLTTRVTASYYDTETTGQTTSAGGGTGLGTADLQRPTGYTGIYAFWDDVDLDGDGRVDADDDAWDFGTSSQYPSLKWGGFDPTTQFAVPPPMPDEPQETSGTPTEVRAETQAQSLLVTWQAVAGATAYRVQWRQSGQAWSPSRQAETSETRYEITGLSDGAYEVRVLAVIDGAVGEPSAAAQGEVGTPGNRPPRALGIADVELDIDETAEVDLDAAFEDLDGDALRYAVAVDGDAVEARVSGATLRLRGALAGEATVTVTATDPDDQSASTSFTAQVGAVLSLHGSPAAPEGGVVALQAELSRPLATDVELGWRMAMDDDPTTADADAADFGAWAGTATFAAGETRARIAVAVLDDDAIEPAREHFAVELEQPEDGNVGLSARAWRVLGSIQEGVCDRTPEVRAELSRNWRACHWPRPSDLSARTTLNLRGHGASALRSDDLLGLSRLRTLDLGRNALQELPTGLLRHTPRLRSLRLDGNRLQSLPAGLFADIAGLRELRLAGNPGAPFALAPTLRRTDAEPWAAGPATVEAALPLGAPFPLHLALSVADGEATAEALALAAGKVASDAVQVSGDGPARVSLAAPTIPQTHCGNAPCFDGLAAQGATLALFVPPPQTVGEVAPAELLGGGDATRIDLSAHFAASETGGALSYTATLDDPRLATVSVTGALLTVTANEDGEEGTVTVTVVATDDFGQTATLRFEVEISPRPSTRWRGWRSTVAAPAAGQEPAAGQAPAAGQEPAAGGAGG